MCDWCCTKSKSMKMPFQLLENYHLRNQRRYDKTIVFACAQPVGTHCTTTFKVRSKNDKCSPFLLSLDQSTFFRFTNMTSFRSRSRLSNNSLQAGGGGGKIVRFEWTWPIDWLASHSEFSHASCSGSCNCYAMLNIESFQIFIISVKTLSQLSKKLQLLLGRIRIGMSFNSTRSMRCSWSWSGRLVAILVARQRRRWWWRNMLALRSMSTTTSTKAGYSQEQQHSLNMNLF